VRIPASLNRIAGLRPSTGGSERRYSGAGALPLSHTLDTVGSFGRTVTDVALLDSVLTGTPTPAQATLAGLRVGVPAVLWSGLESQVDAVVQDARTRLVGAGVVFIDVDMPEALTLSDKIIFPVALHDPIADIPKFLSVHRPALQKVYSDYFRNNGVDAIIFPTSPVLPASIDAVNGSSTMSVDGGPPVGTFTTTIRNMGPGSCVGVRASRCPPACRPAAFQSGCASRGRSTATPESWPSVWPSNPCSDRCPLHRSDPRPS